MITFPVTEAEQLALTFLMEDLDIPEDDREFFSVLASRLTDNDWYVVEVGIEGLPDKWVLQVFNTGECDPCYTFVSPISASETDTGLEEFPPAIADVLAQERRGERL
jgi:hypothetical protein